jgi:hypothetical protein
MAIVRFMAINQMHSTYNVLNNIELDKVPCNVLATTFTLTSVLTQRR